ncbi:MAG: DNA recombination protein RmuC [Bacteroidota bacterium]
MLKLSVFIGMFDWLSLILGLVLGLLLGGLVALQVYLRRQRGFAELSDKLARLETLNQQLNQQQQDQKSLDERLKSEFGQLAREVLDHNRNQLLEQSQQSIGGLLEPLRERLTDFAKKVEDSYQQEARERFHLQKEIQQLVQLNQHMSEEARNLTRALKGDSKAQGNWGELVLSRVLESSGLREGEEFVVQGKDLPLRNEEGRRLQPDVIVKLPDDKHLIVDAKVSLTAYERFVEAEEESVRQLALKQHLHSIRQHIEQLSQKHYSSLSGLNSPDFVLLFMPIEPAFSLAVQHDPNLFSHAWERKIVLVSPTTLLATLKTVASIWKLEQQNANAQEIALRGGALYDKFVGFVEELDKLGLQIDRSQRIYQQTMLKLRDGNGNLIRRAEQLRDLGVKHKKRLKD